MPNFILESNQILSTILQNNFGVFLWIKSLVVKVYNGNQLTTNSHVPSDFGRSHLWCRNTHRVHLLSQI